MFKYLTAALLIASTTNLACAAAPAPAQGLDMYVSMCKSATDLPSEYGGESDLKGNAKLDSYCHCFTDKFVDRMKKIDPRKTPSSEQTQREEFDMRKSCRAQLGLPAPAPLAKN
jgi:hypothetical protein